MAHRRPLYHVREDGYEAHAQAQEWDAAIRSHGFLEHRHGVDPGVGIPEDDMALVPRFAAENAQAERPFATQTVVVTLRYDRPHGMQQVPGAMVAAIPFARNFTSVCFEIRLGPGLTGTSEWLQHHDRLEHTFSSLHGVTEIGACVTWEKDPRPGGAGGLLQRATLGLLPADRQDRIAACVNHLFACFDNFLLLQYRPFYCTPLIMLDPTMVMPLLGGFITVASLKTIGEDQGFDVRIAIDDAIGNLGEIDSNMHLAREAWEELTRCMQRRLEAARARPQGEQVEPLGDLSRDVLTGLNHLHGRAMRLPPP